MGRPCVYGSELEHVNDTTKFFGLYRGSVVGNLDPMQSGRISVVCPEAGISVAVWALPCVPITAGPSERIVNPPIDSTVWLQFEAGDPMRAVWIGSLGVASQPRPVRTVGT